MTCSDEELLEDLKRVAEQVDGVLTKRTYNDRGKHAARTLMTHFGSWNAAKKSAGLETCNEDLSDEELLQDLKQVAQELGKSPSTREYNEHGNASTTMFYKRFGTWNNAKKAAGLKPLGAGGKNREAQEHREMALQWIDETIHNIDNAKDLEYGFQDCRGKKPLKDAKKALNRFRANLKRRDHGIPPKVTSHE